MCIYIHTPLHNLNKGKMVVKYIETKISMNRPRRDTCSAGRELQIGLRASLHPSQKNMSDLMGSLWIKNKNKTESKKCSLFSCYLTRRVQNETILLPSPPKNHRRKEERKVKSVFRWNKATSVTLKHNIKL